jgi:small redox-active disulfide protein 2
MEIRILGTGCSKCKALEKVTRETLSEMGIDANIQKEEDIVKILGYGIMNTPGLVINGRVVSSGRVLSSREIKDLISENR